MPDEDALVAPSWARTAAGSSLARADLTPRVALRTTVQGDFIEVWLDLPPVLDFTRGEVQRTLLLARSIVEPLRGRLAFGQADDQGLRIKLALPADGGSGEG